MKARIVMILMAAVLVALPTMAQQQEWRSTSAMQGTGSSLAPQVTAVGATSVGDMATTTGSAKAPGGSRKIGGPSGRNPGDVSTGSTESPIGDALLPLMLMALAFGGYTAIKRRKLIANS